jgi:hypothetical protein
MILYAVPPWIINPNKRCALYDMSMMPQKTQKKTSYYPFFSQIAPGRASKAPNEFPRTQKEDSAMRDVYTRHQTGLQSELDKAHHILFG